MCIEHLEVMPNSVQWIAFFPSLTNGFARMNEAGKNKGQ